MEEALLEKVFLKMNKKKHLSEIWNKLNDGIWSQTDDPNNVTAEPKNMPACENRTEDSTMALPIPTPQPPTICDATMYMDCQY